MVIEPGELLPQSSSVTHEPAQNLPIHQPTFLDEEERMRFKTQGRFIKGNVYYLEAEGLVYSEKPANFAFQNEQDAKTQVHLMDLLTQKGLFHPHSKWFFYHDKDGKYYGVAALMPMLQQTKSIKKPDQEARDVDAINEPTQRIYPAFSRTPTGDRERDAQSKFWFKLYTLDALKGNNWADDGTKIYPIDSEVIRSDDVEFTKEAVKRLETLPTR